MTIFISFAFDQASDVFASALNDFCFQFWSESDFTAVFGGDLDFGKNIMRVYVLTVFDDYMSAGRQVVYVAFQYPDDTGAAGGAGNVTLTVTLFVSLEAGEGDTTGDICGDVLGCAFGQVLLHARWIVFCYDLSGSYFCSRRNHQQCADRQSF